jgi:hypothetical protein
MERLSFYEFLLQAWRASISKKLPWVFGAVIALASISETRLGAHLPETASFDGLIGTLGEKSSGEWLLIFFWLIFLFVIGTFGKSNLIASLSFVAGKTGLPNYPTAARAIGKNFLRALFIESLALLLLLLVIIILSLPLWIASSSNPEAVAPLTTLGFATLIPIVIIIFFIRQYALFYLLLSPLSVRSAIETGAGLFSRFVFPSLLFGLFSFALTALFTFFLNLAILSIVALSGKVSIPLGETAVSLAAGFVFFAWFAIFQQALWLAFFKAIAGTRDTEKTAAEKEAAFADNNLPETPPA